MKRIEIKKLYENFPEYENKTITVAGWVKSIRVSKSLAFINLNDGGCHKGLQIVVEESIENFKEISKQNVGAAIYATGVLTPTPTAKQPFELKASQISIEGTSSPEYPLQKSSIRLNFYVPLPI